MLSIIFLSRMPLALFFHYKRPREVHQTIFSLFCTGEKCVLVYDVLSVKRFFKISSLDCTDDSGESRMFPADIEGHCSITLRRRPKWEVYWAHVWHNPVGQRAHWYYQALCAVSLGEYAGGSQPRNTTASRQAEAC